MAVAVDATGTDATATDQTHSTWTYGPSGTNLNNTTGITTTGSATAIVFLFCWQTGNVSTGPGTTTITWDPTGANQNFTLKANDSTTRDGANVHSLQAFVYVLANPSTSGHKDIKVTTTNTGAPYMCAVSFSGTDTTNPSR